MRFARVVAAYDRYNPTLDPLVETADLDVLQLDYRRSQQYPANSDRRKSCASGVVKQLRTLHKTLYLDPGLRVITDAGGENTMEGVEAVANYLCEHDDAQLPITAIRGDNVFANIEMLMAEGIELKDRTTGTLLQELPRPILSAHVELGAGPIKTALDDGSRFVICGCYDIAAPAIAASANAHSWDWDQHELLAQVAIAANSESNYFDVEESGVLLPYRKDQLTNIQQEIQQAIRARAVDGQVNHADVRYQADSHNFSAEATNAFRITDVASQTATRHWLLRATYLAEYFAEIHWKFESAMAQQANEAYVDLKAAFRHDKKGQRLEIEILESPVDNSSLWLHASFSSLKQESCEPFIDWVSTWAARWQQPGGAWQAAVPQVQCRTYDFCCEVPREAIAVSVDTRPAKEWR